MIPGANLNTKDNNDSSFIIKAYYVLRTVSKIDRIKNDTIGNKRPITQRDYWYQYQEVTTLQRTILCDTSFLLIL